jgi:hypothetical protein
MAYLYRHIRLDKNEPFYIGIGEDNKKSQGTYKRAYNKQNRNKHWKNITSKTQYKVDIVLDDLSWEEACIKEIEFIALYGRKDLRTGILTNKTNGGDGIVGQIFSKECLEKKSVSMKEWWKNIDNQTKENIKQNKIKQSKGKPKPEGFGDKISGPRGPMSEETKQKISIKKTKHSCFNEDFAQKHFKPVIKINNDGSIEEFKSIKEAELKTGVKRANISCCLTKRTETAGGYKWLYKEENYNIFIND